MNKREVMMAVLITVGVGVGLFLCLTLMYLLVAYCEWLSRVLS